MSTRAVYTFKDADKNTFAVYKHHDGYPTGAAEWIGNALDFAWSHNRFEAADFAAAFIAGNKGRGGGGVYMTKGYRWHGDLDYDYVITDKKNVLHVTAYEHQWDREKGVGKRKVIFSGPFVDFVVASEKL